jgi:ribosomal peptide maturation radical SAM protein 1
MEKIDFRVALITMPFSLINHPSIQLGLLQALGEQEGFLVDVYHLNLHMAARISSEVYNVFSNHRGPLTSEWLFSKAAFGKTAATIDKFFCSFQDEAKTLRDYDLDLKRINKIRTVEVPLFLEECVNITDWSRYDLIGFSSTFQQNVASFALAKRLKKHYLNIRILFGGANMEGEMGVEYLRAFSFIDFVCVGEGDLLFPLLLRTLSTNESPQNIPGLAYRVNGKVQSNSPASPLQDLDSLPVPIYQDFFDRCKKLNLPVTPLNTSLPLETARGCWWGEKHHCTFCGLNGMNMKFRSKSIQRVLT